LIRSLAANRRRHHRRRYTERTVLAGYRIITEYPQTPIEAMALGWNNGDWMGLDWIASIGVLVVLVVVVVVLVWSAISYPPLLLWHAFARKPLLHILGVLFL
jgi:hypothetical protein